VSIIADARQVEAIERMRVYLANRGTPTSGHIVTDDLVFSANGHEIQAGDTMWRLGTDTMTFYVTVKSSGEQVTFHKQPNGSYHVTSKTPGGVGVRAHHRLPVSLATS
jgi:plastocyanin